MMTSVRMISWAWWPSPLRTFSGAEQCQGKRKGSFQQSFDTLVTRAWFPLDQARSGEVCVSMEFMVTPLHIPAPATETRKSSSTSLYHRFFPTKNQEI